MVTNNINFQHFNSIQILEQLRVLHFLTNATQSSLAGVAVWRVPLALGAVQLRASRVLVKAGERARDVVLADVKIACSIAEQR